MVSQTKCASAYSDVVREEISSKFPQSELIYDGPGIDAKFSSDSKAPQQIREALEYFLGAGEVSKSWFNSENLQGIVRTRSPEFLAQIRIGLQEIFYSCGDYAMGIDSPDREKLFEAFIGHLISIIPYTYPDRNNVFSIPQKIDGAWRMVDYRVDQKIELTHQGLSGPISAYGLVSDNGPPILTFLGTTFPTGEGFLMTLLADFTPFLSVGHLPYWMGKDKINAWLEGKQNVQLHGLSLGGALAFHVLRSSKDRNISRANIYNAPGLYPWNWKQKIDDSCKVNIYYQGNDLVGTMGILPEGKNVSVYRIAQERLENPLSAHIRAYEAGKRVFLFEGSAQYENRRAGRRILTALHFCVGGLLFSLPILLISGAQRLFWKLAQK